MVKHKLSDIKMEKHRISENTVFKCERKNNRQLLKELASDIKDRETTLTKCMRSFY